MIKDTHLPLVSVIVPTYNSSAFLERCLQSIDDQTYKKIELIVVDNNSTDTTKDIAKRHTSHVYNAGPERSAQRNYGVRKCSGEYVLIIDSDMELSEAVVGQCVEKFAHEKNLNGIVIPEESFGEGYWAQCKRLERSFYVGVSWIEAARAFPLDVYLDAGGYNEALVSGEDWDLSKRVEKNGSIASIQAMIRHNEGHINLRKTLKKKYYYAQHAREFLVIYPERSLLSAQAGPLNRYRLFFGQPSKLLRNPLLGIGMLFMKTAEFAAGVAGLVKKSK